MVLALRSVREVAHGWENQAVARGVVDLLARTDFPSRDWTIGHVIDELVRSGPGVPYWHAQRMLPILLGLVDSGGDTLTHERSEEHTSELQSLMRISYAVFCLKKKQTTTVRKCKICT